MLVEALQTLTENECKVITFIIMRINTKEIRGLEVSESRISQITHKSTQKIKKQLVRCVDLQSLLMKGNH